jgi:acetolactate synthase I/II/III large subunit
MDMLEKTAHHWTEVPAGADVGEAVVTALAAGGVDHLFFTSGAEIVWYQEAIAKAHALGRPAPRLITMTHEHASLNAALGYAAASGKPAATAVHVDTGTYHYGGAIHTAAHAGLPVMIMAGGPPVSYPGTMKGSRDRGGHLWMQQSFDQNGIVRNYVKWDHRLEYQDNPGLMASRALQVAQSDPRGPVYMSVPREIALLPVRETSFPSASQLGIPRSAAADPDGIREIAQRLLAAEYPYVVVSSSGRDPKTVPALVTLCELLALPVATSAFRSYLCFPMNHPLNLGLVPLADADVVVALDANVPWVPGASAPPPSAYVAVIDADPIRARIPTFEFTADLRLTAGPLGAIEALTAAVRETITAADRARIEARRARYEAAHATRRIETEQNAQSRATKTPIDPLWLSHEIGAFAGTDAIVLDETLPHNQVERYLQCSEPGSYIANPASSGGYTPGAALGVKLARPDKHVIAVTGDGFYMFSTANAALLAGRSYGAPFTVVIYQNGAYSTGTLQVSTMYPESYAKKVAYDGGTFGAIDFAKEAEACGAYGETVTDPAEITPALHRARRANELGSPAVISVVVEPLFTPPS